MTVHRRGFLAGSAAAVAGLSTWSTLRGADTAAPAKAALRLSSQISVIPGRDLEEKLDKMQRWGFDAVELHGDVIGNEKKYLAAIAKTSLKPSAICFGSIHGALISPQAETRAEGIRTLKRALDAASEIKAVGVIYVPAFNDETKLTNQEIRKIVVDTLPELGDYAHKAGTRILLEPLNRKEAFFMRQLADGAAICRDCKSPGVCMMGDFYHMGIEETSDLGAFLSAGKYLHHVHLASRIRVLPGQDDRSYIDGFRGLKMIGYQDYCSYECGVRGDRDQEIPKSMAFLRQQWAQATV